MATAIKQNTKNNKDFCLTIEVHIQIFILFPLMAQKRHFHLPAQPKARWYLDDGLNLTQHTFALASMLATELSRLVDHNFTKEREEKKKDMKWMGQNLKRYLDAVLTS